MADIITKAEYDRIIADDAGGGDNKEYITRSEFRKALAYRFGANGIYELPAIPKIDLATQVIANVAGTPHAMTIHQIHQRIADEEYSTTHYFQRMYSTLPGVVKFMADAPSQGVIYTDAFGKYPDDCHIEVIQVGSGAVTIIGQGGVTIYPSGAITTRGRGALVILKRVAPNLWTASGDILTTTDAKFDVADGAGASNITGNGAEFIVDFNSVLHDPSNGWDASDPKNFFTVTVPGLYDMSSCIRMVGMTSVNECFLRHKNSNGATRLKVLRDTNGWGTDFGFEQNSKMYFNAGETISCSIMLNGEGGNTCDVQGGSGNDKYTYFSAALVG